MNSKEEYDKKVTLLIEILSFIREKKSFALKGGTAINFFYKKFA
jgi:hypothetical protein